DVLPAQDGVFDLGDDALLIADDAGEEGRAAPEARDQVIAELLLHRPGLIAALAETADRVCSHHVSIPEASRLDVRLARALIRAHLRRYGALDRRATYRARQSGRLTLVCGAQTWPRTPPTRGRL